MNMFLKQIKYVIGNTQYIWVFFLLFSPILICAEEEDLKKQEVTQSDSAPVEENNVPEITPETTDVDNVETENNEEVTDPELSSETDTESLSPEELSKLNEIPDEEPQVQERLRELKKKWIPTFDYDPLGRADPFTKPGKVEDVLELPQEEAIHPIENQDIGSIRLKAILWSNDEGVIPRALFEAGGKHYTLSKYDRIGNSGAIIARIDTNRVWYMVPFMDPSTKQVQYKPDTKRLLKDKSQSASGHLLFDR